MEDPNAPDMMDETPEAPKAARVYLSAIEDAQKAFADYQDRCDNIEKQYANLKTLADITGEREMQMFWANMEVMRPTIYQRAPQPVVQERFRGRNPVAREAAEILERALTFDIEDDDLHETLKDVRDDLVICGRGVPWVLDDGRAIHVDRHDFVHEPARKWSEVGWVARRAYLTRPEFTARFPDADHTSAKFEHHDAKDDGDSADYKTTAKKAQVWECWHKADGAVYWVTEGVEDVLDAQPPLIDVKGFFPCPKPAYGTVERRTLLPVPDYTFCRDQFDEINELTARISALAESLRLKGFYAAGVSEIGEAVEAAMKATDNKAIMVPVSSAGSMGGQAMKDAVVWLPVQEVANVITALIALRKQLIEDVYEISGISDIMRGNTVASETATAQNLKAQYGSVRVRERQNEMVRVARDVIRIKAEIYAEQYDPRVLAEMAQKQLPTQADLQQQMMQMQAQFQQQTQMAQQAAAQGQQAPEVPQPPDLSDTVTIDAVGALLRDQRLRPFVLEVESDSTIAPNEQEEKASRMEFVQAMGGFIQQAGAMVVQQPETASFAVEVMKFAAGAFRAGRELDAALDEFAETIESGAAQAMQQRGQPTPEQQKMQADAQAREAELKIKAAESAMSMQIRDRELELKAAEIELKQADLDIRREDLVARQIQAQADSELRRHEVETRNRTDLINKGLPPDYSYEGHAQQLAALTELLAQSEEDEMRDKEALAAVLERVEQGEARTADALAQMAAAVQSLAETMAAPKRVVRENGAVVGVETVRH